MPEKKYPKGSVIPEPKDLGKLLKDYYEGRNLGAPTGSELQDDLTRRVRRASKQVGKPVRADRRS